jgi:hypothetical protein
MKIKNFSGNKIMLAGILFFISTLLPAILGLALGEIIMARQFTILQPILGSMTFVTEEIIGAFLIDFPLACLSSFLYTKTHTQSTPRDGIMCGVRFLSTFFVMIGIMALIGIFDVCNLSICVITAVKAAILEFNSIFPVMIIMFLCFDYLFCMGAGLVGFYLGEKR